MDLASSGLMRLRPVTFRYKKEYDSGEGRLQYGLIAEEVAQVYPELVVNGDDGKAKTVEYQKMTTNLPFEHWTEVLGNERLTGALLDRITHRVHIIEANGESYRLRDAKSRAKRKRNQSQ